MNAMNDTMEFVRNMWGAMKVPGMTMPSMSPEEINKQITDLKAVESWLQLNMNMLRSSIQALEMQSATLSTLQTMGDNFAQTMKSMTPEDAMEFAQLGQSVGNIIGTLPCVTIAKVRGFALGGGCELAMACDMIVAGKSARFGQPEVNLGLVAGFGGTQRLVKRVGIHLAMDMLLTGRGRMLTGDEAFNTGLASRVVDDDKLDAEIDKIVDALTKTGPAAVAETKRLIRDAQHMSLDAGLAAEAAAFALCFARNESKEGIDAFLSKRTPKFQQD
jgi:enoyl-CoA hydratase